MGSFAISPSVQLLTNGEGLLERFLGISKTLPLSVILRKQHFGVSIFLVALFSSIENSRLIVVYPFL
jgi:hypothetical protein